ncbi:MAG: MGMT family protein [Candidatus Fimenecus sp.]
MQEEILKYLLTVPKGKVVTYGQIAVYLGNKNLARAVGNALHRNPDGDKYPCYKVVNSKGELSRNYAFGGIEEQKKRLEKDGVKVFNYKVDLEKYKLR